MALLQELLPQFDPFGISEQSGMGQQADTSSQHAGNDTADEVSTPLAGTKAPRHSFGSRHRRTTSEPTPMDSWQLRSEWPQH